jgi:hypothetical protein
MRWCELDAALVAIGRVDDGTALLDEAMAGGAGREGDDLDTVVLVSAARWHPGIEAVTSGTATQWVRAADGFNVAIASCPG